MAYYLSKENRAFLVPFVRIIESTKGDVRLDTQSPNRLIYLLRTGANTEFPSLKNWIFKKKESHVLAIPKNPLDMKLAVHEDYVDYVGLINILVQDKPESMLFTNIDISDVEYVSLQSACEKLGYHLERLDTSIKVFR